MTLSAIQLALCCTCTPEKANFWLDPIVSTMQEFGIDTPKRQAAFLAQIGHESKNLERSRENLNYTPQGLLATFNTNSIKRFNLVTADCYGRTAEHQADQRMIANIAYANRMGNGDIATGDGWDFRGGGPGQLTGRNNFRACGKKLGIDLEDHPELIETPLIGARAFGWFWNEGNRTGKSLNAYSDRNDIAGQTLVINGGSNGMAERIARFVNCQRMLGAT